MVPLRWRGECLEGGQYLQNRRATHAGRALELPLSKRPKEKEKAKNKNTKHQNTPSLNHTHRSVLSITLLTLLSTTYSYSTVHPFYRQRQEATKIISNLQNQSSSSITSTMSSTQRVKSSGGHKRTQSCTLTVPMFELRIYMKRCLTFPQFPHFLACFRSHTKSFLLHFQYNYVPRHRIYSIHVIYVHTVNTSVVTFEAPMPHSVLPKSDHSI